MEQALEAAIQVQSDLYQSRFRKTELEASCPFFSSHPPTALQRVGWTGLQTWVLCAREKAFGFMSMPLTQVNNFALENDEGAFMVCPEFRYFGTGMEYADSFNLNAYKALLINFDCSRIWSALTISLF